MAYMTGYPILGISSTKLQLLIVEKDGQDFHVLSYYEEGHSAIKDGNLIDANELIQKIKKVYEKTNFFLNSNISSAVLVFPDARTTIARNEVELSLQSEGSEINLKHINDLFKMTAKQLNVSAQALLNIFPISFSVSGISDIENPKGLIGQSVELDSFLVTVPKDLFMNVIYSIEQAKINILEIFPTFYCNIIDISDEKNLKQGGNIVEVAYEHTMISIYEDGIPQKTRLLKNGINGIIQILMNMYQISYENAIDLLNSSVYFDEETAQDIVVYRLELPEGVLDITEQDLAQALSEYMNELFSEIRGILEHFNAYSQYPIIFIGELLQVPGYREMIKRFFPQQDIQFYSNQVVGLREFNPTALIGAAKMLPARERLFETTFEVAETEDINLEIRNKKWRNEKIEEKTDKHEKTFWDKIANYFFD